MATKVTEAVIPKSVWVLGLVSLFMDVSSEIIHALLPLFLTITLGASVAMVGLIDGVAEATASISKVFSGYLSDRIGRRKPLILLGYGLGMLSKPLFPLASSAGLVFGARFADRIGKGLRGAPRDALVADITPPQIRGRAFGLRQALDTTGAFIGPLSAIGLMALLADDMRLVFTLAIIPATISVWLVIVGVEDRRVGERAAADAPPPLRLADIRVLGRGFWTVVLVGSVFTLARFSEAFLVLRASGAGLPLALAPLVLVVMNIAYSTGSYPAGAWADRAGARWPLLAGMACLILADLLLAAPLGLAGAFGGIVLWGVHMALTQGLLAKLVADSAPGRLRGSAFGLINLMTGLALLAASVLAGILWDRFGASATFLAGGALAAVSGLAVAAGPRSYFDSSRNKD